MPHEVDGSGSSTVGNVQVALRAMPRRRKILRLNHTGPIDSIVRMYAGQINDNQYRDGSSAGVADVAEYPQGLSWPAGVQMIWLWDKPGNAYVHVEYDYDNGLP